MKTSAIFAFISLLLLITIIAATEKVPTAQEIIDENGLTEICYDGVIYLHTYVRDGKSLTAKIDSETLKPIKCE